MGTVWSLQGSRAVFDNLGFFLTCDKRGCELIGSIATVIEMETAFGGKSC